jgi:diadenosine tetraphosphate (Ap4A) HIT family hydrolase
MSKRYFGLKNRRRWLPGWRVNRPAGWAVQARFKPVKLNYVTLGNTVPHVDAHVLPGTRTIQPRGRADRLGGDLRR